ncbi:MAG: hypothetical protein ACOVMP_09230 [Chthoniobacterales bacterium]
MNDRPSPLRTLASKRAFRRELAAGEFTGESITRIQHMPRYRVWRIFRKRADGNWQRDHIF